VPYHESFVREELQRDKYRARETEGSPYLTKEGYEVAPFVAKARHPRSIDFSWKGKEAASKVRLVGIEAPAEVLRSY
jgi:hypothetical protein